MLYLAQAPKGWYAVYHAYGAVRDDIEQARNDPVPLHLRNAVTSLMRGAGYGERLSRRLRDAQVDQGIPDIRAALLHHHRPTAGHGVSASA